MKRIYELTSPRFIIYVRYLSFCGLLMLGIVLYCLKVSTFQANCCWHAIVRCQSAALGYSSNHSKNIVLKAALRKIGSWYTGNSKRPSCLYHMSLKIEMKFVRKSICVNTFSVHAILSWVADKTRTRIIQGIAFRYLLSCISTVYVFLSKLFTVFWIRDEQFLLSNIRGEFLLVIVNLFCCTC